eukprot:5632808-Prymnesium_polylepis.1
MAIHVTLRTRDDQTPKWPNSRGQTRAADVAAARLASRCGGAGSRVGRHRPQIRYGRRRARGQR